MTTPIRIAPSLLLAKGSACADTAPPPGRTSELFPPRSCFMDPLATAPVPPHTDFADIEEEAHVLTYTVSSGQHTCELWWMGGDGGTPILAYLVDGKGAHYLPRLSQPKVDGEPPFDNLEQATRIFIRLAEQYYGSIRK